MCSAPILDLDPISLRRRFDPSGRLDLYLRLLQEENRRLNLVSRETSADDLTKLALQSLVVLEIARPGTVGSYLDIGSGGGLPSIPLLLCDAFRNGLKHPPVLVERTGKKAAALRRITLALKLPADIVVESVEQARFEDTFDLITMRLVKLTPSMLKKVVSLLSTGGQFICFGAEPFESTEKATSRRTVSYRIGAGQHPQALTVFSRQ